MKCLVVFFISAALLCIASGFFNLNDKYSPETRECLTRLDIDPNTRRPILQINALFCRTRVSCETVCGALAAATVRITGNKNFDRPMHEVVNITCTKA